MKLLCFMVLLRFGVSAYPHCNRPNEHANKTKIYFYTSTDLNITENYTGIFCNWNGSECHVECTPVNLTTNITSINHTTSMVESTTITNQHKMLVFNISEQEITCNIRKCEILTKEIHALINKSFVSDDLKDLKRPMCIKKMCSGLFERDPTFKKLYIRAEKMYIDAVISLPFTETTKNYDIEDFNMIVVKMDMMNITDLGLVQISAPKVPDDDLPLDVFIPPEPFMTDSAKHKAGIVTYPSAQMFKNGPNTVLKSKVIRVETVGNATTHLSTRLVINFTMKSGEIISENHTLSCQFYNVDAISGQEWDLSGSFTSLENFNSSNIVTCSYDHMTPFAVLLVDMTQIDSKQWIILSYISYIGCGLSAFFSAVTIFLYTFMKRSDRDSSIHIHVSLSVAIFLLNTSFLFIEWGATLSQDSVCVLIAVIIQYSLLSCFSWTAIEAMHLYLLLIKVFNTYIKHYMVKLSLFGWGVPAVLVGGSLCVFGSTPFYGTTKITLSDTNEATQFCWITDPIFLYGMNISYFSLTFLFNTSVLVAVTHQICKLRRLNITGSKLPSCKDICTVLGLTFLLGMTWGLAFFSAGYINYPILYLFCICNTLQGLFLFLWFCGAVQKKKRLIAHISSVSKPASTTVNTYESSFTN